MPLLAHVGGGKGDVTGVADPHEIRMGHGLFDNQVQVPGGGVVLIVVQTGGVHEVCVFTPQLLGLFVHGVHEFRDGASDRLRQNTARLVGGDHHHAVQQLFHGHDLAGLDAAGAAVLGQILKCGGTGRDFLVHLELAAVHCFQCQQSGHDFGQAGGIELFVFVFGVGNGSIFRVHQQSGLCLYVGVFQRGGRGGGAEPQQQCHQQKDR